MNSNTAVVIPARNEARTIAAIVLEVVRLGLDVIVVDDGSADETTYEAERVGAVVIRHQDTRGYTSAILTGISEANRHMAEHIVTLDGDGAHDPQNVPSLLSNHIDGGFSLTIGSRLSSLGLAAHSTKLLVNRLAWPMLKRASGMPLPNGDYASGLRVYSHEFAKRMLIEGRHLKPFGLCFFSIFDAIRSGLKVSFSPCNVRYDASRLLYTNRGEFLDFLSTVIDLAVDQVFMASCLELHAAVQRKEKLRFILCGKTTYAIHLGCPDGYIFQEQCLFYDEFSCDDNVATLMI